MRRVASVESSSRNRGEILEALEFYGVHDLKILRTLETFYNADLCTQLIEYFVEFYGVVKGVEAIGYRHSAGDQSYTMRLTPATKRLTNDNITIYNITAVISLYTMIGDTSKFHLATENRFEYSAELRGVLNFSVCNKVLKIS